MKTRSILFLAALASAVFTGCTNDDEAGQAQLPDLSGTPIRIQAGINEGALTRTEGDGSEGTEDGTQAATQPLASGEFGLFLTTPGTEGNERYNATNMKFSRAEGAAAWTSDRTEQLLWKNNKTTVSYYAYMPYVEDAAITDGVYNFTLPTAQDTEFEKADLLYAPLATASATDDAGNIGVLGITFRHALTRLTVVLERGNADGYNDLEFSSVKLMGCATEAAVNLETGVVGNPTGSEDITLREAAEDSYECILIPQTNTTLTVAIEAGQRLFQYTSGEVELKPGTHYTLKLTVGYNALTAGNVSLIDWQEGSWGNKQNPETGTAEEIKPGADPETHTIVTLKVGEIAEDPSLISEAMNGSGILKVSGPMNQDDMNAIDNYYKTIKELDLSEATGEIAIRQNAFSGYYPCPLQTLILGSNVTSIGSSAFKQCTSLQEVDLSACSNLTSIGTFAFKECGITDLKLPMNGKLATIEASAFQNHNLQSITFPETLKEIGPLSLATSTAIETVVFLSQEPPSVEILMGYETEQGDFTDLFYQTGMSNITIYLPNVKEEDAEWTAFFVDESNYKGVKYGESLAAANP